MTKRLKNSPPYLGVSLAAISSLLLVCLIGCNRQDSGNSLSAPAVPVTADPGGNQAPAAQGRDQVPDDGGVIEPSRPLDPDKFSF